MGLRSLKVGDLVKIHAWGEVYNFELRENYLVKPNEISRVLKHEEQAWLTLVTCEDYSTLFMEYTYRRVARAVLVSVEGEY
jgi:LPXTG-site transpeptidase (sortase) family protein